MTDRPTTEPRTEAGRRMLHRRSYWSGNNAIREAILAIEAEAAQGAAPRAEGLDVGWLAEQMLLIDGNHDAFVARIHAERLLPRLIVRLSRPSDERDPESEATR